MEPTPYGPSRIRVSGTGGQPMALPSRYAAYSRLYRVPPGKSYSGRSPAFGLYTARRNRPGPASILSRNV